MLARWLLFDGYKEIAMNQCLFLRMQEPNGEVKRLKLEKFPAMIGTSLVVEERDVFKNLWILKSLRSREFIEVGDLRFPAVEIPFETQLKIGDAELFFSLSDPTETALPDLVNFCKWLTRSTEGLKMLSDLKCSSKTNLSIFLLGETGTGKEVLASQIHSWSDRADGPFVAINCGALAVALAESELFGHTKGSFTGASRNRMGALMKANHGTLFLDEVGDLPLELQVKLLRFLENGEVQPVGSDHLQFSDVRVVCATHQSLLKLITEGKFRQDLYYRLASITVEIPSLDSRPEDVKLLSIRYALEKGKTISNKAIQRLQGNHWAGNVRELRHAMERAMAIAGKETSFLDENHFEFLIRPSKRKSVAEKIIPGMCTIRDMERVLILRALKISNGNRTRASKLLGIARSTLFEMIGFKMKRSNLPFK